MDTKYELLQEQNYNITSNVNDVKQTITSSNNTTNNYGAIVNESMDESTLLSYADQEFQAENYEIVVQVYSMDNLKNNPIACNNLGYMYANGIYFPENVELADYYYDKAIEQGDNKAFENKMALHFRICDSSRVDLLRIGYQMGNEATINFFASHIEGYSEMNDNEKAEYLNSFLNIENNKQEEFLEYFYEWKYVGKVYLTFSPVDSELIKYICVDIISSDSSITRVYEKWEKTCLGLELLEENMEKVE
jgi:TPR repeat protein